MSCTVLSAMTAWDTHRRTALSRQSFNRSSGHAVHRRCYKVRSKPSNPDRSRLPWLVRLQSDEAQVLDTILAYHLDRKT
jgi:hypothetical protein